MTLYLTPAEDMKTYLDEMKYKDQRVTQKMIGVDTAKYMLEIDGRSDEIHTGGGGWWGEGGGTTFHRRGRLLGERSGAVPQSWETKGFRCHDNLCGDAGRNRL